MCNGFGDLDEIAFLSRLYAPAELPSSQVSLDTAEGDITQHRYNNYDWEYDWIYTDERFGLSDGPRSRAPAVSQMVHPEVRSDDAEAALLAELVDSLVRRDGLHPWQTSAATPSAGHAASPRLS
ncbi:AbiJ-related protein [Streptomyces lydicus]|uniref:AbiJ-related protein n=1 Tax=Streptomyces lydicus TaxID=47763 RepID=UPI0036E57BA0